MRMEESVAVAIGVVVGVAFLVFFVVQSLIPSGAGFGFQGGVTPSGPTSGKARVITVTTPNVTTTLTVTTPAP